MNGLVPAIIQDYKTKNVLMLGFMNEESYNKTIETKKLHFGVALEIVFGLKVKLQVTS